MTVGDAFWMPDGHCWFVLSHPNPDEKVVIANFTTRKLDSDDTCVVITGEHPDIRHESVVAFAFARLVDRVPLEAHFNNGTLHPTSPLSPDLLSRIQQGALTSEYTRQNIQNAVRQSLVVPLSGINQVE